MENAAHVSPELCTGGEGAGLVLCGAVALEVLFPFAEIWRDTAKIGSDSGGDAASLHHGSATLLLAVTACEAAALSLPGLG